VEAFEPPLALPSITSNSFGSLATISATWLRGSPASNRVSETVAASAPRGLSARHVPFHRSIYPQGLMERRAANFGFAKLHACNVLLPDATTHHALVRDGLAFDQYLVAVPTVPPTRSAWSACPLARFEGEILRSHHRGLVHWSDSARRIHTSI